MAYEEAKKKLRGSICPVITPFTEDGAIDEKTFIELINWQIESGSHGISVTGTSGEPSSLTIAERKRVMTLAQETIAWPCTFFTGNRIYEPRRNNGTNKVCRRIRCRCCNGYRALLQ